MKKLICIMAFALITTTAQGSPKIVFCKKIGDLTGAVHAFERRCPVGWTKVR